MATIPSMSPFPVHRMRAATTVMLIFASRVPLMASTCTGTVNFIARRFTGGSYGVRWRWSMATLLVRLTFDLEILSFVLRGSYVFSTTGGLHARCRGSNGDSTLR
uniref:Putative secreted protein n=1 Tax=Anopheles darlingi TaxID=43151 RepID=A0A2M4DJ96_ANODA